MENTIRILREQKGFSQTYLASYLQISRQMYIKYESGEVEPPVKIVRALCKLYSVSYNVLIDDKLSEKNVLEYYKSTDKFCVVSEPPAEYDYPKDSLQLTNLFNQIRKLPQKSLASVSAFILLLQQEENAAKKFSREEKSKKAFFDLAGNINMDEEAITAFRQESMI